MVKRRGALRRGRFYSDFRVMLDKQEDIDGAVADSTDHTHAVFAMAAMRAGKHIFCQKPLTHDVYEARMQARASFPN